jgi:hypothetical protein
MSSMSSSLHSFPARIARRVAPIVGLLALSCIVASANPITFTGEDLNAGPGAPHPNSAAAAASFDAATAALGVSSTITFEGAALGPVSSLNAAAGVTVTGTDLSGNPQNVKNVEGFPGGPALGGFNTTAGGSEYIDMIGGTLTFTFATPTQFFGAYLSGVQNFGQTDTVTFSDGTTQTINVPNAGTDGNNGALDFVGFTDAGKLITSVTINAGQAGPGASGGEDEIGVDDVRYQSAPLNTSAVPEPGSLTLVFSGFASLGMGYRRFRASRG